MGLTRFPHGISSFGIPIYGGGVLGPGTGNVFHLVVEKASTDLYYKMLLDRGVDENSIFATLTEAEEAMTSDQNDVLLVYPGDHIQTATITWDKDSTSIVGCGGPNQAYQPSTLTNGGVRISTVTSAQNNILNITGHYVSLYNLGTINTYSGASNICDIKIAGRNFYAENCSFRGGNGATQVATDGAGVPIYINSAVAGGGNAARFVNCVIGSSGNTTRTKGPGCVYVAGGAAAGFGMSFEHCRFSSRIETASSDNVCQIRLAANYAVDRELYFNDCLFYNFSENHGTQLVVGIDDECATTHSIILKNCAFHGMDAICNVATHAFTSDAQPHTNGGEATAVATS